MFHLLWTSNVNLRFSFYSWLQASNNSNWNLVTCEPALIFREFSRISFATRDKILPRDKIFCEVLGMKINAESAECRPTRQPSGAGRACGDRSWAGPGNGWSRWCPTTPRSPSGSNHLGAPLSSSRNTKGELAPRLTWTDDFFIDFGSRLLINNSY